MPVEVIDPTVFSQHETLTSYPAGRGPGMSGLIVFNDLHLADVPPLGRKEGYRDEGLAMLRECVELANQSGARLATTGDLFDRKPPQKTSHWLMGEVREILSRIKSGPLLAVPGNHDMNTTGIKSVLPEEGRQPLANLIRSHHVQLLDGIPVVLDNLLLCSRPYNVHLDLDPSYYKLCPKEQALAEGRHVLMLAHGSIFPNTEEQKPYPMVRLCEIDTTGIDVLISGHIHEDLGIHRLRNAGHHDGLFLNVGALGRVKRTPENRTRQIQATEVKPVNGELTAHRIVLESALPAEDIFVEDSLALPGNDAITKFVKDLTQGVVFDGLGDVKELLAQVDANEETKAKVLRLLEEAGL